MTGLSSNEKLNKLFESFKSQQFDLENLEREIRSKRDLIKRKESSLNEIQIFYDNEERLFQETKMVCHSFVFFSKLDFSHLGTFKENRKKKHP